MAEVFANAWAARRRDKWRKEHGESIDNSSFTQRVYRNVKVMKKHKVDSTYDWLESSNPTEADLAELRKEQEEESSAIASAGETLTDPSTGEMAEPSGDDMEAIWKREAEEEKARYDAYEAEQAAAESAGVPFVSSDSTIATNIKGGIPKAGFGQEGHINWRDKMMHNERTGKTGNWDTDNRRPFDNLGQPTQNQPPSTGDRTFVDGLKAIEKKQKEEEENA